MPVPLSPHFRRGLPALLLAVLPVVAGAADVAAAVDPADLAADAAALNAEAARNQTVDEDPWVLASSIFLDGHPDLRYRRYGMAALEAGALIDAHRHFRKAARFADKPSQGMVAEMLWEGRGVTQDRPLAYAWMEVASERNYPAFALFRELYWQEMSPEERARALSLNRPLWAEYGDAVAKRRLERRMEVARRNVTGSRVGFVGSLAIEISTPGGSRRIDAETVYNERYWNPRQYWAWQDEDWKRMGSGTVDVGPVAAAEPSESAEAPRQ